MSSRSTWQELKSFVERQKRSIQEAERQYDIALAANELHKLAEPLYSPESMAKNVFIDSFYNEVAAFVLTFVSVQLEPGFDYDQRQMSVDVYFDTSSIPSQKVLDALVSTLSRTALNSKQDKDDTKATVLQCTRLLQKVCESNAIEQAFTELLEQEASDANLITKYRPFISLLVSLPDMVFNRLELETPSFFKPHRFYPLLSTALFHAISNHRNSLQGHCNVFRMVVDKLIRIGQTTSVLQSWLHQSDVYDESSIKLHQSVLNSVPPTALESFLTELGRQRSNDPSVAVLDCPKYRLLSLLPTEIVHSRHLHYVFTHRLLLRKPFPDLFFLRVFLDTLCQSENTVLLNVFNTVLDRWCQSDFTLTTDYDIISSVGFFLSYCLHGHYVGTLTGEQISKLTAGIQSHFQHSVTSVRNAGIHVAKHYAKSIGETLDLETTEIDPISIYTSQPIGLPSVHDSPKVLHEAEKEEPKRSKKTYELDPDEIVDSDDDESDVESEASLDAYDMEDEEEDLGTRRPFYLKDVISSLQAENDPERTTSALEHAEELIRKKPRDLYENAERVATALVRLEDTHNISQFTSLRLRALAATCAVAPTQVLPSLQKRALEYQEMLQTRVDALRAITVAAQELSQTGDFQLVSSKKLLEESLEDKTTRNLKTRRFGYRRNQQQIQKNEFADHALRFFSPLLFGYINYTREHKDDLKARSADIEHEFLAHLLQTLATLVECAGNAPSTLTMAKSLLEFAWNCRMEEDAGVRRQVLYSVGQVLLVVPPFLLRQEMADQLMQVGIWLQEVQQRDPDNGCREAARILARSGGVPAISMP